MGDAFYLSEAGCRVLLDATGAAKSCNTRRALAHRVGQSLSEHLPLAGFELGWCDDKASTVAEVTTFAKGEVHELRRNLRGTEILRVLKSGKAAADTNPSDQYTLTMPLVDSDNAGYARLSFVIRPEAGVLSEALLLMLAGILMFSQRHCRLVERVARLSSTAHHESHALRQELRKYTDGDAIVARSETMRRVLESADLVAQHDTPVLLRGESGTGKELLARRIHRLSKRARFPFVAVNCGALPEALIESELFGHERGAFTGATGRHRGRFERANHGTIFLDEVAELPLAAQVKLLRVLQEGEFERVGGEETIRVHVRVLAATHQPLEVLLEQGSFRADLFYRLNVFPVVIPPLRERKEDISALAVALLEAASKRLGCQAPDISATGMARIVNQTWPGNVRELANAIERELIVSRGADLDFSNLPAEPTLSAGAKDEGSETFDDSARRTIIKTLEACGGRIYGKHGAAERLGMPPSTLQGKMRRLAIRRRDFERENLS